MHGRAADVIYSLAPLIFCVTTEVACGFFIVCLSCIPKIFQETRVIRNVKRALGMKSTSTKTSGDFEPYGIGLTTYGSVSYEMSKSKTRRERLKATGSMEHLHDGYTAQA
ncbi:hypothetical protein ETB97_012417 [Aspergillus alliaceus]|uniref:Uncharacterized protein n=2 Tax=Petromyces alliaceus TaxID=209559 RepID=A0A5N7BVP6_PETAA|nr:hypothetical protein BDV23DRAFT_187900 [Aspergillus alliaceus]KAF5861866.1 hypothetical protein ETB97_012417 [Aspergillus burnettii]